MTDWTKRCPPEIEPLALAYGGWDSLMGPNTKVPDSFFAEWESWGYIQKHFFQMRSTYNLSERDRCLIWLGHAVNRLQKDPGVRLYWDIVNELLSDVFRFKISDDEIRVAAERSRKADKTQP